MKEVVFRWIGLGSATACLYWWITGATSGFGLFRKLPKLGKIMRWVSIITIITMFIGGGLAAMKMLKDAVASAQGSSIKSESMASMKVHNVSLALAPPPASVFKMLTRLRREESAREAKEKKKEDLKIVARTVSAQFLSTVNFFNPVLKPATRKGPFCHVTCSVHHGNSYDRETIPEICRAGEISPETLSVPGWYPTTKGYEATVAWPGPATPGFESYKLYWK